jgi:hypothetical protein
MDSREAGMGGNDDGGDQVEATAKECWMVGKKEIVQGRKREALT